MKATRYFLFLACSSLLAQNSTNTTASCINAFQQVLAVGQKSQESVADLSHSVRHLGDQIDDNFNRNRVIGTGALTGLVTTVIIVISVVGLLAGKYGLEKYCPDRFSWMRSTGEKIMEKTLNKIVEQNNQLVEQNNILLAIVRLFLAKEYPAVHDLLTERVLPPT